VRDREGTVTLWQHGLTAAAQGLTTIEQVARVL
jgi:type II secretory ATPase GspE/PulE/Tfp pilus assembly ATPase PilB-like protein